MSSRWKKLLPLVCLALPFLLGNALPIRFFRQPGTPAALPNFLQPEAGCNWSGVGGQVFDLSGKPVVGVNIVLTGSLEGKQHLEYALTGSSLALGPGGFQFKLADHLVSSQGALYLQVKDLNGFFLSPPIPFDTYLSCDKNFVLVNFVEVSPVYQYYYPLINK
jgi:hypothetical protein